MAEFYDHLSSELRSFVKKQAIFFVATAPEEGRINLSPKGMNTFRCLDERTVAYLDLTGSGNETAGHLQEDGRITLMFCSFDKKPLILRLYGQGESLIAGTGEYQALAGQFPDLVGARQIIRVAIESVQTSCGYAVPRMELVEERQTLIRWAEKKGPSGLADYRLEKNTETIDGRPIGLGDS